MQDDPQPKDEHWQSPMPEPLISPDTSLFPNRPTPQNAMQEGTTPTIRREVKPSKQRQQSKTPAPQNPPRIQPSQSQPQQRQPRLLIQRRRVSRNSPTGCASVIVLFIVLAMLFMISSGVNSCMSSSSPSATSTLSDYPTASVGISFTVDGLTTTLLSIHVLSIGSHDISPPKSGDEYIVVNVKLVNNGPGIVEYFAHDFHVVSGAGNATGAQVMPSASIANQIVNGGKLSVGSSRTGAMVFQVPVGDHNARLTWHPIFKDSTWTYWWNLGL